MKHYSLDPRLAADTLPVCDLDLCTVLLMNDARYPWLILVPRRTDMVEVLDLAAEDQAMLAREVHRCAVALRTHCKPDKLNIAALGNVVSQLHVHIIARFHQDDAWPSPVWGVHAPRPYGDEALQLVDGLRARIGT